MLNITAVVIEKSVSVNSINITNDSCERTRNIRIYSRPTLLEDIGETEVKGRRLSAIKIREVNKTSALKKLKLSLMDF